MNSYRKGSRGAKRKTARQSKNSREFQGNQHTFERNTDFTSSSAEKLLNNEDFDVPRDDSFNYCILAFTLVFGALSEIVKCKKCDGDIKFSKSHIRGLGFKLHVQCSCGSKDIKSSPPINSGYEINRRIVFVMRMIGVGRSGLEVFCALMDMAVKVHRSVYYDVLKHIEIATKAVSEICLKKAADEEKQENVENNLPADSLTVSGDGTWSKRGFTSLLGVATVIGKYTNKVLDWFVSSKRCQGCEHMRATLNNMDFDIWYEAEHKEKCTLNYEGSSGGMEVQGIIEIFKRSMTLHKVKYSHYIGDGDSKTFSNLEEAKPYGDFIIKKLECVLHVGKRMFRYLKELKKTLIQKEKLRKAEEKKKAEELKQQKELAKETPAKQIRKRRKLTDGPAPPPPPKCTDLTGPVMKKISFYYSLAIQSHPDSKEDMKKAIWAIYYHLTSTDANPQHDKCDAEWCGYLKAQHENKVYKHKPALKPEIQAPLKEVFEKLSDDALLQRCLGKNTQNNNECFNGTLWAIIPKHNFVGKEVVEIAVQLAVIMFNEGRVPILKVLDLMGCPIGIFAHEWAQNKDWDRIRAAQKANAAATKEARLARKEAEQEAEQAYKDLGLLLYGPGMAD